MKLGLVPKCSGGQSILLHEELGVLLNLELDLQLDYEVGFRNSVE